MLKHTSERLQMLKNTIKRLLMLKHTSKRLKMLKNTIKRLLMLKHTSKRLLSNKIAKKMFEVEHLIYNQWCSQNKSDIDS